MSQFPAPTGSADSPVLRQQPTAGDRDRLRAIVERTGAFNPVEVAVAVELLDEWLAKGPASGYHFLLAELRGQVLGYACYGPIPLTAGSYDLYWIAVEPAHQGRGIGSMLLGQTEELIRQAGGRRVYVETSGRASYEATRAFYRRLGYHREAVLADFYAPGDDKVIYVKALSPAGSG